MLRTLLAASAALPAMFAVSASAQMFDIPASEQETYIDLGLDVVSRDIYVGSDERETLVLPYVNGEYKGRFFFRPAVGAGVNLINDGTVELAAVASYATGRDAEDTPFVFDIDDLDAGEVPGRRGDVLPVALTDASDEAFEIDGSITVGGYGSVLLPFARLDAQLITPVTGDIDGLRSDIALTTRVPLGPFFIAPGVRATWTSDSWTETFYGFTPDQIATLDADTLALLSDENGLDVGDAWTLGAHLVATWEVVDDVQILGFVNYSALQGDAKDSLFSPENDGVTAALAVSRRF